MFINSYQYQDSENSSGWSFSETKFGKINLFVGLSGAGKSRYLNSIVNLAAFAVQGNEPKTGMWKLNFTINDHTYLWSYKGVAEGNEAKVKEESLSFVDDAGITKNIYARVVDGENAKFTFNEAVLPKLPKTSTGISLLKEEEIIKPIYYGFQSILRRNFFGSELQNACAVTNFPSNLFENTKNKTEKEHALLTMPLNIRLFYLKEKNKKKYSIIIDEFRSVFPTIENIDFMDGKKLIFTAYQGDVPLFTIRERGVGAPIPLHELSSGMQKVLLILTDIVSMENGGIYMIDEYENSLGVNAIDFLPDFLVRHGEKLQFFLTSHHPNLINRMPVKNWHLFHRIGSNVKITSGPELDLRYSKSHQEKFIQMINDPLYMEKN